MQNKIGTLWLIGAGNMGGALARKWVESGACEQLFVVDPNPTAKLFGATVVDSVAALGEKPDAVVLAVKPDAASAALVGLDSKIAEDTAVISVMAGTTFSQLHDMVSRGRFVRAMPNTPAQVGKGATGLLAQADGGEALAIAEALFSEVGAVHRLDQETDFDALTALSGSGPAYVFRMVEAMAAAGEAAGLSADLASKLARETVIGAGALLEADARPAADLRRAVTSPGGTTEAGLEALDEDPGLPALLRNAIRAAAQRSRDLGNGS